jgi:hypothetical protein
LVDLERLKVTEMSQNRSIYSLLRKPLINRASTMSFLVRAMPRSS